MDFGKETETLEFKKTTGELKEAVISISSIINKHGKGELYFGIKDNGTIIGQQIGELTLRDISKAVSDNLKPQVFPVIDAVTVNDKPCIRVVFEGDNPPYFAYGRAYIRVADEDKQLSPEQLEEFFRKKISQTPSWDSSPAGIDVCDIDEEKLRDYIRRANEVGRIEYGFTDTLDILKRLKLLKDRKPCNAANVMFGKDPGLQIQMAAFATEEKLTFNDIKRHHGTVSELVNVAERYIRNTIRWRVIFDGSLKRTEVPEIPMYAIREALQNSFAHKDFLIGQNNEVAIFSNRIEIYNPGTFPVGMTPEDFIEGVQNSIHRNPLLAELMYYVKDIESFGTGLRRIADTCKEAGVKYQFDLRKYGFAVIFYRKPFEENGRVVGGVTTGVTIEVPTGVSAVEELVLVALAKDPKASYSALSQSLKLSRKTIGKYIKSLKGKGVLERIGGNSRNGNWQIVRQ